MPSRRPLFPILAGSRGDNQPLTGIAHLKQLMPFAATPEPDPPGAFSTLTFHYETRASSTFLSLQLGRGRGMTIGRCFYDFCRCARFYLLHKLADALARRARARFGVPGFGKTATIATDRTDKSCLCQFCQCLWYLFFRKLGF